jgi:hypothetical protein
MRRAIETAPRDGKIVILEDDASGSYDVAHWSRKTYQWVGENGEPSKITPTHWYPRPRDQYLLQQDDRSPRRFAAWSIIATLIAMALSGVYFRAKVRRQLAPPHQFASVNLFRLRLSRVRADNDAGRGL